MLLRMVDLCQKDNIHEISTYLAASVNSLLYAGSIVPPDRATPALYSNEDK